jgi:hypothetical protein
VIVTALFEFADHFGKGDAFKNNIQTIPVNTTYFTSPLHSLEIKKILA